MAFSTKIDSLFSKDVTECRGFAKAAKVDIDVIQYLMKSIKILNCKELVLNEEESLVGGLDSIKALVVLELMIVIASGSSQD